MNVKTRCLLTVVVGAFLGSSGAASASIFLTPGGLGTEDGLSMANALGEFATGNQTSQAQIDAAIAGFLGSSVELYKNDNPAETGSFASSYSATFDLTPSDPSEFTIEWDGGSFITAATHLLVKDGNQSPAWYLYNITGLWDGMSDIDGFNFWPGKGAISHVTIYGDSRNPPGGTPPGGAPEPMALVVWSLLIGCVGSMTARWTKLG